MSKELSKAESKELAAKEAMMAEWGPSEMSAKDIVIPRIILAQPVSDSVTNGDAAFGDFRDTLTNRKIGDFKQPFKFIPFYMKRLFVEYDATDPKKKKYLRVVPIDRHNESLPYEDEEKTAEGKTIPISRDYTMNFYGLLPDEVARGGELPYILTFRRTSLKEGKKLYTQMEVTNRGSMLPPPGLTITIAAKKTSNDDSTWAIPEVLLDPANTERTGDEAMMAALKWYKRVKAGETRDDDASLEKEVQSEVKATVNSDVTEKGPAKF